MPLEPGFDAVRGPAPGYSVKHDVETVIDRPGTAFQADRFKHPAKVAGQPIEHVKINRIVTLAHASFEPFKLDFSGSDAPA
jgi:hypothetical protein